MPENESEARRVSFLKKPMAHDSSQGGGELERGLSAPAALGLNIIDMVGVGPFVTLPLIVIAMGGPSSEGGQNAGNCCITVQRASGMISEALCFVSRIGCGGWI